MKNTAYTITTDDRKKLFVQSWVPEDDKKKLIILIHGLGEHSSRYEHWAELFTQKGYTFLSMDLRGHGKSEGKKGHTKSMDQLLDDIDLLLEKANEIFPDHKRIFYGHSMGGALVLNHIIKRNRPFDAVIITSPWFKLVDEPSPVVLKMVNIFHKIIPSLALSNRLKAEQISGDPEIVRDYATDPLIHDRITLRMFHEIYNGGHFAYRNVYKINYPMLVMHGKRDTILSYKASENYVLNTSNNIHLKLWENQSHELQNELIKKEVFEYIINWLAEYKL
jgi:alpha-beta hydrolase superfamily lysophospholipase